jgi:hypothetical protein
VRVEHHLLAFARIGPHKGHPAVAQADMRHLDVVVTPTISCDQSNW